MENINSIIKEISKDRGIELERVQYAIQFAIIKTAKDIISRKAKFEVDFGMQVPKLEEIYIVVENHYNFKNQNIIEGALRLKEALDQFPEYDLEVGSEIRIEHEISSFGHKGLMILQKNIEQAISRLITNATYFQYKKRIGERITAKIIHINDDDTLILNLDDDPFADLKVILKKRDSLKNDNFKIGDKISASIKYIIIDKYDGKITLELSRTSINFLVALLKLNVPEIEDGIVVIHSVARIPGEKAKVAVSSNNPRIDPISAVIGVRGRRVHEISRELNGEIIDCINYSSISELYIRNSLSPAKINNVKVKLNHDDEVENKYYSDQFIGVATVKVEQNERGKAIGKNGINLKLTRMLTGFDIELITIEKKDTKESEEDSSQNQSNNKTNLTPKVEIEERRKSVSEKLGALFN